MNQQLPDNVPFTRPIRALRLVAAQLTGWGNARLLTSAAGPVSAVSIAQWHFSSLVSDANTGAGSKYSRLRFSTNGLDIVHMPSPTVTGRKPKTGVKGT